MPDFTPDRIVKVEWNDAWKSWDYSYEPHEFEDECHGFMTIYVGVVLVENNEGILLSLMWNNKKNGDFNKSRTTCFVPRGMIVKITELVPKVSA